MRTPQPPHPPHERASNPAWLAIVVLIASAVGVAAWTPPANAAPPALLHYQGLALDANADPLPGPIDVTARLYTTAEGSTPIWSEYHPGVPTLDGVFTILLGGSVPLEATFLTHDSLYLEVEINGEALTPRQPITSVPYAVRAQHADCQPGDMLDCYTGTPSTLDRGTCHAGRRTCDITGAWGLCEGEQTPSTEVCGDGLDGDCDGAADIADPDCADQLCTAPGTTLYRCDGDTLESCSGSPGAWEALEDCASSGEACTEITAGVAECQGECETDVDCPADELLGAWGACGGYSGFCDETGMQTAPCRTYTCVESRCESADETCSRSCTRNTDGDFCPSPGGEGVCANEVCIDLCNPICP